MLKTEIVGALLDSLEHRRGKKRKKKGGKKGRRRGKRGKKGRRVGQLRLKSKAHANVKVRARFSAGGSRFGCYAKRVKNGRGGTSIRGYCSKALAA